MKILVPIEDPFFASALIDFICRHKWTDKTEFHLLHVIEPFLLEHSAQPVFANLMSLSENEVIRNATKMVEEAAFEMRKRLPELSVRHEVKGGRVVPEIMSVARRQQADLIISGSHGRSGFNSFLLGSVSLALVTEAQCPVLLVKPEARVLKQWDELAPNAMAQISVSDLMSTSLPKLEPHRVLVCVDGKDMSNKLVNFLFGHRWTSPADYKILSIVQPLRWGGFLPLPDLEMMHGDLLKSKKELVESLCLKMQQFDADAFVEGVVLEGQAKQKIIKEAIDWKADLIVLGCQRGEHNESKGVGSVSFYVLSAAPCSVLLMKDGQYEYNKTQTQASLSSLH